MAQADTGLQVQDLGDRIRRQAACEIVGRVRDVSAASLEQPMCGRRGNDSLQKSRDLVMWLLQRHGKVSFSRVSRLYVCTDRTVMNAVKRVEALAEGNQGHRQEVDALAREFAGVFEVAA